jgi:hypothetical protein
MEVYSYFRHLWRFVRPVPKPRTRPLTLEHPLTLNRRSLLISLGLTLPAGAAAAATSAHKKKQPHHATKTASSKSHGKSHTHPAKPAQS